MQPVQSSAAAANPQVSAAIVISLFFIIRVVSALKGPNFPLPVFLDEGDEGDEEGKGRALDQGSETRRTEA